MQHFFFVCVCVFTLFVKIGDVQEASTYLYTLPPVAAAVPVACPLGTVGSVRVAVPALENENDDWWRHHSMTGAVYRTRHARLQYFGCSVCAYSDGGRFALGSSRLFDLRCGAFHCIGHV